MSKKCQNNVKKISKYFQAKNLTLGGNGYGFRDDIGVGPSLIL